MPALATVKGTAKTKQLSFNPIRGSTLNSGHTSQSLRRDNAYWSKIMTSTGSQTTFTTSFWIKRTSLGNVQEIWSAYDGSKYFEMYFESDDTLKFSWDIASTSRYVTARKFRDIGSWYHIVIALDSTQATAANRRKLYVNGVDISAELSISQGSEIVQNSTCTPMNKVGATHRIGSWAGGGNYVTRANFSEFYHIDGRQLTQFNFGGFNATTGEWQPRKFVGNTQWTRYTGLTTSMMTHSGISLSSLANIIDDDITTTGFHTDSAGIGSHVTWDLGAGNTQAFRRIRFQLNGPTAGPIAQWNVQYSDDNSSWTTVNASVNVHPDYSLTKRSYYYEVYASWGAVGAHRYWRVSKTNGASGGDYHQGISWYTLTGIDHYGSCGFYLPFDKLFDNTVTNIQLPDLGDSYFTWSGRSGYANATDDRSQSVTVYGSPTVNTSGGPKSNNGYFMSGFTMPNSNGATSGVTGIQTGDSVNLINLPSTGQTWSCWLKSTQTGGRPNQWTTRVVAFGDYRGSVYAAFGLNNGRVAFGMASVWEGTTNLADGNWHHIAMVYDGGGTGTSGAGTWTLYADGQTERVIRSSQEGDSSAWNLAVLDCVGFHYPYPTVVPPTAMTGICVYKRALSDTEILGLYNGWDPVNSLDRSGNANHFYSTGSRTDLEDSPTDFGNTDTGVGGQVAGNYPIMNPYFAYDGEQTFGGLSTTTNDIAASFGPTTGKWYWEYKMPISDDTYGLGAANASGSVQHFGVVFSNTNNAFSSGRLYGGGPEEGKLVIRSDQNDQKVNGNVISSTATTGTFVHYFPGDYVGMALDLDANPITLRYYRNGVLTGTHSATYNGRLPALPFVRTNGYTGTINFGQWTFRYPAPSGYKTLNTTNLPKPSIVPNQHFDTVMWTGNGTSQTISSLNFQPDLIWLKGRNNGSWGNFLQDSVRGVTEFLKSNETDVAGTTTPNIVNTITSSGFTVLANGNSNNSSDTYVAWCWKAGNGTTTNTNGAVTSTVSVNQAAGFSIVSYAGTGSNTTTGHGLNGTPDIIWWKARDDAYNWDIYVNPRGFQSTLTQSHGDGVRNVLHASPTSTTIPVTHTYTGGSGNGKRMIAYCWRNIPGYSMFGTYNGNSSAAVFVQTGFKPAIVVIKPATVDTSANTGWRVYDNKRNTINTNATQNALYWSSSQAEVSQNGADFVSNGFYLINSGGDQNHNRAGCSYVFMAFAETPLALTNAR